MMTKEKVSLLRLCLLTVVLLYSAMSGAWANDDPLFQDPDPYGSGGGGNTCAKQCPDGSWAGIGGCPTGTHACCMCTGGPYGGPVQGYSYCEINGRSCR